METCLSLCSGAGGFDLGAVASGLRILASVEMDQICCQTLSMNFDHKIIQSDVAELSPSSLRANLGLCREELDYIIAGPPCQPFSKSAFWAKGAAQGMNDPRSDALVTLFRFVKEFRPKVLVIENVEGFKSGGGLDYTLGQLRDIGGYTVNSKILLASDYGVPQKRRRIFIVAWRKSNLFDFPEPTHGKNKKPEVSSWEAFVDRNVTYEEDLTPRGKWSDLLPSIPEGSNYQWHTERGGGEPLFGWRTRYWSFLQKLSKHKPAPTIVASPSQNAGPFHWDNRELTSDELAALQTFPKDFRFSGDRSARQKQIGNAVPPLLAQTLITEVQRQLGNKVKPHRKFHVQRSKVIPKPSQVNEIPEKFKAHIGVYAPHPGTGKGPRPRKQRGF